MPRTPAQAIGFLLGFWLAIALSPLWVETAAAGELTRYAALEAHFLAEINRVRASHHLIALERRHDLDSVARTHSEDMARRGYFSHHSPDGSNPLDRIRAANVDGMTLAAENLGKTTDTPPGSEIIAGWLRSPDHRRNLLAPAFNATGIGIARGSDGALLFTQLYIAIPATSDR